MITVRRAAERGHASHGWLDTWHTFSFASYQDPQHLRFRSLRVMNEDRIAPGQGFGTHPHNDMEIVTYVLSGALEHRDSMGHGEVLRPGEFQRMSAGTGITHSEFNPSPTELTHLYQIWLYPRQKGMVPGYEQKSFPGEGRRNQLQLVASESGENGSLVIHTDARIFLADVETGRSLQHSIASGRHVWLQILRGRISVNQVFLSESDGAAISDESSLTITAESGAELLIFDLA